MSQSNRRTFMLQAAACGSALGAAGSAFAQPPKLDEKDPQAVALGYLHDTAKVDGKKYPNHKKAQNCTNCALYQGKATDAWAMCPLFAGKLVAGPGWCSAWAKKG